MEQTRTYPAGVTCWVDTEQPDVDAAMSFYGKFFGWTFESVLPPDAPGRYVIASLHGRDAGAIGSRDAGPALWNTYVAVDDADAAVLLLTDGGATVRTPPYDAGPGGRTATIADPQGAELRLWQARRRLGAQAVNEPGGWNFSDLHTADPDGAAAFYRDALAWVVEDEAGFGRAIRVPGYGDHLESTVDPDIRKRQADAPEGFADVIGGIVASDSAVPAFWRVTFTVADRDDAAAKAERLGATVLGTEDSQWTRKVLLRDPQGAEFMASQFTPPSD
jgi:predicted enzyme related to lactoylglutathione lyase